MYSAALDEDAHENEEHDTKQYAKIPVFDHILLQCMQRLLVEQKIL